MGGGGSPVWGGGGFPRWGGLHATHFYHMHTSKGGVASIQPLNTPSSSLNTSNSPHSSDQF